MSVAQKSYRVIVADDHAVVRSGLKHLLEEQPGVEVCCEATTGVEAVRTREKNKTGHGLAGFDHAGYERPRRGAANTRDLSKHRYPGAFHALHGGNCARGA